MLSSFLCCFPHSQRAPNNDSPVIPDENTHLIPARVDTTTPELEGRIFRDRLAAIVRSTQSKMVNVGARMPFCVTLQSETPASAHARLLPHSSPAMSTPLSRRPLPVLTMTPASACNMHSSSASSVSSSRVGSRTSSPRRRLAGADSDRGRWTYLYSDCASKDESAAGVSCGASGSDAAASASVSACATPVDVGPKVCASHMRFAACRALTCLDCPGWDDASGSPTAAVAIIGPRHWQKEPECSADAGADVNGPPLSIAFSWSNTGV
ncbi:hypothetical protein GGX14DRAFT_453835 [Mycena pura]|uniref:Uncharacterized protein n=1 Tax=Mycena pura TaxID=153505 RepID=A0AAD6Y9C4_9AGAR|nr:hypothetical protein GGX14DRAFT_453835 [Mycena pura]